MATQEKFCTKCKIRHAPEDRKMCSHCIKKQRDFVKEYHARLKAEGKCAECTGPLDIKKYKSCSKCREKRAAKKRARDAKLAAERRCLNCGKERPYGDNDTLNCNDCRTRLNKIHKYKARNRVIDGECVSCGEKPAKGSSFCEPCREHRSNLQRNLRERREKRGVCVRCKAPNPNSEYKQCEKCRNELAIIQSKRKENLRINGLCVKCTEPVEEPKKYSQCKSCRDEENAEVKKLKEDGICTSCRKNDIAPYSSALCEPCFKRRKQTQGDTRKFKRKILDTQRRCHICECKMPEDYSMKYLTCEYCRQDAADARKKRVANGMCSDCGIVKPIKRKNGTKSLRCYKCRNRDSAAHRRRNRERKKLNKKV